MNLRSTVFLCVLLCLPVFVLGQATKASNMKLEHGKYLVTRVGMCADCHSPRNERGEEVKGKSLQGAPLPFQPTTPMPWIGTAPPIAGLEGYTDAQAMMFLTTGVKKDGKRATPPMPEFRFSNSDAAAVIAYLRSMKPAGEKEAMNSTKASKK